MQIITKYIAIIVLSLAVQLINAQENLNSDQIKHLETQKELVETQERELLRIEVERINSNLDSNKISKEEADKLKQEQANKHALNIKNRLAIIDNKIALLQRNENTPYIKDANSDSFKIKIGKGEESYEYDRGGIYIGPNHKKTPRKYDRRTTSDLVFAIGFNNAIIEGESLNDSPYKLGGSGFVELGWAWKTRVFKNSNAVRFKYGFSFQWNKLDIKDDLYFNEVDDIVSLDEFPIPLKKSKFRTTNLVFPIHFEFGPSKKIDKGNYFRYSTYKKFKIAIGAYGGFNISSLQKLKYEENGESEKDKIKNYNTNNFVYGLSSYVSFGSTALYVKYDLSPIFKDQDIDQNNISLGLRFDLD